LKVQKEDLDNCQVKLIVEVGDDRLDKAMREAAKKMGRNVRVPGFRPGRAPYQMVLQTLGPQAVLEQAVETLLPVVLGEAIEQTETQVWSYEYLDASVQGVEPLTFEFVIPTPPVVALGDIDQLVVEQDDVTVEDESVDEVLQNLRDSRAVLVPSLGPAAYGDQLTLDLRGDLMDGSTIIDQKGYELTLVERETETEEEEDSEEPAEPDIGQHLVGMMVNQVKEFPLVYPANWPEQRYAGRTVLYRASLLDLKKRQAAELTDEFAQEIGAFDTLDELRQRIRENLQAEAEDREFDRVVFTIIDQLADESELDYPDAIVQAEIARRVEQLEAQMAQYGLKLEQYLEASGKTQEELEEDLWDPSEEYVRRSLTLTQYIADSELSVSEEEIEREMDMLLVSVNAENVDAMRQQIREDAQLMSDLAARLVSRKGIATLYSRVTGEEAPPLFPPRPEAEDGTDQDEALTAAGSSEGETLAGIEEQAEAPDEPLGEAEVVSPVAEQAEASPESTGGDAHETPGQEETVAGGDQELREEPLAE
jgi:trigger factor